MLHRVISLDPLVTTAAAISYLKGEQPKTLRPQSALSIHTKTNTSMSTIKIKPEATALQRLFSKQSKQKQSTNTNTSMTAFKIKRKKLGAVVKSNHKHCMIRLFISAAALIGFVKSYLSLFRPSQQANIRAVSTFPEAQLNQLLESVCQPDIKKIETTGIIYVREGSSSWLRNNS